VPRFDKDHLPETQFERLTIQRSRARSHRDSLALELRDHEKLLKASLRPDFRGTAPRPREQIEEGIVFAEEEIARISSGLFECFAESLGVRATGEVVWSKKLADSAIEDCFGSLEKPGNLIFSYPGLTPVDASTPSGMRRAFSLYLGKKAFPVNPLSAIPKADEGFLKRVTEPFKTTLDTEVALVRMKRLVEAIWPKAVDRASLWGRASGKSCLELSNSAGGKRAAKWVRDLPSFQPGVAFTTIESQGKLRTITVDSFANHEKYYFLNPFMLNGLRKFPWLVSGRTVDEWLVDFVATPGADWISGDLEAATDTFHGEFAEVAIRHMAELFFPDDVEGAFEEMCAFTTRAKLLRRSKVCIGCDGQHTAKCYEVVAEQKRGQLMGSILSFPILCVVNLLTVLCFDRRHAAMWDLPWVPDERLLRRYLLKVVRDLGINGDDLGTQDVLERKTSWQRGVSAVGGRVSPGKTLLSPRVLTINSMLVIDGVAVDCVRPSLMAALADGAFKVPSRDWLSLLRSPDFVDVAEIFSVEEVLFPDQPRPWGGLGVTLVPYEEFVPERSLFLQRCRAKTEFSTLSLAQEATGPNCTLRGGAAVVRRVPTVDNARDAGDAHHVTGWVYRDDAKALARKRFGIRSDKFRWTFDSGTKVDPVEAWRWARETALQMCARRKGELYKDYVQAFLHGASGHTWVEGVWASDEELPLAPEVGLQARVLPRMPLTRVAEFHVASAAVTAPERPSDSSEVWLRHWEAFEMEFPEGHTKLRSWYEQKDLLENPLPPPDPVEKREGDLTRRNWTPSDPAWEPPVPFEVPVQHPGLRLTRFPDPSLWPKNSAAACAAPRDTRTPRSELQRTIAPLPRRRGAPPVPSP
jgi:hypothetical protein